MMKPQIELAGGNCHEAERAAIKLLT